MTLAYDQPHVWHRTVTTPKSNWWPSALILAIVFISFRPFTSEVATVVGQSSGGDIVNQLGFGGLGLACFYLMAKNASSNVLSAFVTPTWFIILAVLVLSVLSADNPTGSMRAMIFSLIVVLAAATALALPRNMDEMASVLGCASATAVAFCYVAVLFFPEQGTHTGAGFEPQHAGLWRGVYDHKNVASYVMGAFALIGWFVMRNGKPLVGLAVVVLSVVFVVQAGSKTVLGILPAAFFTAAIVHWVTWGFLRLFLILLPILALTGATLGAAIFPPVLEELRLYIPGLSYTGRTDLWIFGLEFVQKSPWLGYGFESFWGTARIVAIEQPIELSWDVRGIVHGHNSWLDAAIAFGLPGAFFITLGLTLVPIRDYLTIPQSGNAGKLASLFLGIWIFTALGANLESFFFRRSDPVWFCMLLAVIGLRLTAHMSRQQISASFDR